MKCRQHRRRPRRGRRYYPAKRGSVVVQQIVDKGNGVLVYATCGHRVWSTVSAVCSQCLRIAEEQERLREGKKP